MIIRIQETPGSERRNQLELRINLFAEQENPKMLAVLARIAERLDIRVDDDPAARVLASASPAASGGTTVAENGDDPSPYGRAVVVSRSIRRRVGDRAHCE